MPVSPHSSKGFAGQDGFVVGIAKPSHSLPATHFADTETGTFHLMLYTLASWPADTAGLFRIVRRTKTLQRRVPQ